jgi:hypothetical protein
MLRWRTQAARPDVQRNFKVSATALDFGDLSIPLRVRRHRGARRITLSVDAARRGALLTLPARASMASGFDFVAEKALWLRNRLALLPAALPFRDGATIPIGGEPHCIRHRPEMRGGVWREPGMLVVTGGAEHLPRRVADWLRALARETLAARTGVKAAAIGKPAPRIFLRDPRSRWGSCAREGRIHYSWRLILAPDWVLDYVVAHEVAHLSHLGHGQHFWALVERLTPHRAGAESWLRRHGHGLHMIGATIG